MNRGGARPGSGRKPLGRVTVSVRISPHSHKVLKQIRAAGYSVPDTIDKMIQTYAKDHGIA